MHINKKTAGFYTNGFNFLFFLPTLQLWSKDAATAKQQLPTPAQENLLQQGTGTPTHINLPAYLRQSRIACASILRQKRVINP